MHSARPAQGRLGRLNDRGLLLAATEGSPRYGGGGTTSSTHPAPGDSPGTPQAASPVRNAGTLRRHPGASHGETRLDRRDGARSAATRRDDPTTLDPVFLAVLGDAAVRVAGGDVERDQPGDE